MNAQSSTEQMFMASTYVRQFPAEAAEQLESVAVKEVVAFVRRLNLESIIELLTRLSLSLGARCIVDLPVTTRLRVAEALDPGRLAALLSHLKEAERTRLLESLPTGLRNEINELMTYPEGSAGTLMEHRFVTVGPDTLASDALRRLRRAGGSRGNCILVVNAAGQLLGLITTSALVFAKSRQKVEELLGAATPSIHVLEPREEVVEMISRHHLSRLPVIDTHGCPVGIIHQEALVKAAQDEALADLQTMVGAGREERALSSPLFAVSKRLPWLNINLLTAFLAAAVVGLFENTIAQFTALAVLLPVVAGQSGNTGAQALAVVMRGLALREIRLRHAWQVMSKEGLAGAINGVAIAIVTAIGVYLWSQSGGLALVIGVAMVISMSLAGLAGAAIPLVLTRLGQDPAQSASIILTTVTDVVGFFSFLALATVLSGIL